MAKLAFDQAARLFRMTIEIAPGLARRGATAARTPRHRSSNGVPAARVDAAREYLKAAEGAPVLERAELERAAAVELLSSGQMVEGAAVLHRVLGHAVGLSAPGSVLRALFLLIVYRIRLVIASLVRVPIREARNSKESRGWSGRQVDSVFSAAIGFATTNVVLGTCMAARGLLLALRSGDRFQVMRAALIEASQHAGLGGKVGKLERALVDLGQRISKDEGTVPALELLRR